MSESKFTPGPWQVAGQFPNMTFVASTGKDADCICKCDTGDSENLPHAANARLIASAPDLLEALERSHGLLQRLAERHTGERAISNCIDEALKRNAAVLSKVRS